MLGRNFLILIFAGFFVFNTQAQRPDVEELKNEVKAAKSILKAEMEDLRYDGSKVTYYEVKRETGFKDLEVILFLRDDYTLFFNGDASSNRVALRVFDKPSEDPNRILLYEVRNISNKTRSVSEQELNEQLQMYMQDPPLLRKVHIEYEVSRGRKPERGAIVMMLAYEN